MDPKVYIIVLNYKGWEDTIECLESLLKLDYSNFQIIVVDNASGNESLIYLKAWIKGDLCPLLSKDNPLKEHSFPLSDKPLSFEHYREESLVDSQYINGTNKIVFIESVVNNGYSSGNNQGMEYGLSQKDGNYFWILNNDTTLPSDSLRQLVNASEESKRSGAKVGIWGGKLLYYHNPSLIQNVGAYYYPILAYSKITGGGFKDSENWNEENVKINHIVGASLFVSIPFVLEVGKLSEDYFLYMEEVDWAIRARQHGWQIRYCPKARIFHKEGMSINNGKVYALTGTKSKISDYYWTRNKILITRKFYPFFLPLVIPITLISVFSRIKRKQTNRIGLLLRAMVHAFTGHKVSPDQLR